jgi:diaminopimelate epimerase
MYRHLEMDVKFTKMHGSGNDFIVVDEWDGEAVPHAGKPDFIRSACDRHFGIGSDGVIFLQKSAKEDFNFAFYNPDGSRAEMCGNGIRCTAKYAYEHGRVRKRRMTAETLAGTKVLELTLSADTVTEVKVDMGRPQVKRGEAQVAGKPDETFIKQNVMIQGFEYSITAVGMGNPHAVMFYRNVDAIDVADIGARVRNYTRLFPNGTNVHFVQKVGENEFRVRTYERGVEDETLACGTGICASAVAAVLNRKADPARPIVFHARGGEIRVELEGTADDIRKAHLIGPAVEVYSGGIRL